MYRQMSIFDIAEPRDNDRGLPASQTLFEQIFTKISNPVVLCANCLCNNCANNAEEVWHKVKPDEIIEACFTCDDCREYTGDTKHKGRRCEDCEKFVISEYGAACARRKMRMIE